MHNGLLTAKILENALVNFSKIYVKSLFISGRINKKSSGGHHRVLKKSSGDPPSPGNSSTAVHDDGHDDGGGLVLKVKEI